MASFYSLQVFQGNHDRYTPVSHDLETPIIARYIRIHPETWKTHISMRAEFYGCRDGRNSHIIVIKYKNSAFTIGIGYFSAKAVCLNGEYEKLMKHGWEASGNFQYLRFVVQP